MILAVLIAVLVGRNHATSSSSNIMKLVMLQRNGSMIAAKHDSACLDGSDYGYYILKSNKSSQWVISFQGGGWCFSGMDCVQRSGTQLGSSKEWPKTVGRPGGVMGSDCTGNPQLCNASVVVLNYCDGNSFAGARVGTVEVEPPSTPLSSSSTRASTDSTSTNDGTNGNSTARKYYCSTGALLAGHDVDVGLFPTVEAAEKHCNANSTCTAFTYRAPNSTAPPNAPLKVYFKSSLAFNGDAAWKLCWQSKTAAIRLRGRANLDATLDSLLQDHGLDAATEVLLTGSSAGGLASYLHADYVHSVLKRRSHHLVKYKYPFQHLKPAPTTLHLHGPKLYTCAYADKTSAARMLNGALIMNDAATRGQKVLPDSGYFVDHPSTLNEPVIETQFKSIFELSNATATVPRACVAAQPKGDAWRCNFAQHAYASIEAPIMVVQSTLDLWQTGCIMTAGHSAYYCDNCSLPAWRGCMPFWKGSFTTPSFNCTHDQMAQVRSFQSDVQEAVTSVATASKQGNGLFLHACHDHCIVFHSDGWAGHVVNGVAASSAIAAWWASGAGSPAPQHTYVDTCLRDWNGTSCNPSCGAVLDTPGIIHGRDILEYPFLP